MQGAPKAQHKMWSEMLLMMHVNFLKYDIKSNPINKKFKILNI